ncbi:MAG: hypothetical protein H7Y16_06280 [Candidatus Parcubacteria bacterium]|nr:hypothetical protein [Burkholderiales bacterium]
MLRVYLPRSVKITSDSPYLPNILDRYFDSSEFSVVRDSDEKSRLILLPCSNPYQLSRKLAALKGGNRLIYDSLPEADLNALRKGAKNLAIDMGGEMFFTRPEMIDGMHEGLAEVGISRSQLLIINGDANSEANYRKHCSARSIADTVSILALDSYPLFLLAHQRMEPRAFRDRAADIKERRGGDRGRKAFLNFNGRSRPHRIYTVLLLMAYGLMESGLVSLLNYGGSTAGTVLQRRDADDLLAAAAKLRADFSGWPRAEICLPHVEALLGKLPLELDLSAEESIANGRYRWQTPWEMQNLDLYHRSHLSLVTDTLLPKDKVLFVTEKVYKSFVGFHPFIYIGSGRALEHLRTLGFQTFHPFIDESYDLEPHGPTRLVRAVDALQRFASLPEAGRQEIYDALWPRVLHNALHACVDAPAWVKAKLELEIRQPLVAYCKTH